MERSDQETRFLNVDLDLYATSDLRPLVSAFGRNVSVLHVGRIGRTHQAHLELARMPKNAGAAVRSFSALVARLAKRDRLLWNGARARVFNIGVQAGAQPHAQEFGLSEEAVAAAHAAGAAVVFTVYAPEQPGEGPRPAVGPEAALDPAPARIPATRRRGSGPRGSGRLRSS